MLICALFAVTTTVLAEAREHLPDLGKALPGGKLMHQADPEIMVGYRYEYDSNSDFEALKKKLKDFLGEGWKENEVVPGFNKALKQVMKVEGIDLVGQATFSNPAFSKEKIILTMKSEKFNGKEWHIVDISGTWYKNAEQAVGGNRR